MKEYDKYKNYKFISEWNEKEKRFHRKIGLQILPFHI